MYLVQKSNLCPFCFLIITIRCKIQIKLKIFTEGFKFIFFILLQTTYYTKMHILYKQQQTQEKLMNTNTRNFNSHSYNAYQTRPAHDPQLYTQYPKTGIPYSQYRVPTYQQKYGRNPILASSGSKNNPSSRISDLNERISQQTEMIRRRSGHKYNFDTRSTSSQLKRSRMSADRNRRSPTHSISNNYMPTKKVYYPYDKSYSLSSSRASDQILNNPIITHTQTIRQPILTSNNGYYPVISSPSFKKYPTVQPKQETIPLKPILKTSKGGSMFQQYTSNQYENKQSAKPQKKYEEGLQQFLDMDFNQSKRPSMQSIRDSSMLSMDPVSPVTYPTPTPIFTHRNSDRVQQQLLKSNLSPLDNSQVNSTFSQKVKDLLTKVDNQGKMITIFLVGLGLILVIFQAIK